MNSWIEYIEELLNEGKIDLKTLELIESGTIEICPICMGLNSHKSVYLNPERGIRNSENIDVIGQWLCGHCGSQISSDCDIDPLLN